MSLLAVSVSANPSLQIINPTTKTVHENRTIINRIKNLMFAISCPFANFCKFIGNKCFIIVRKVANGVVLIVHRLFGKRIGYKTITSTDRESVVQISTRLPQRAPEVVVSLNREIDTVRLINYWVDRREISVNPRKILLELLPNIGRGGLFPTIKYMNSLEAIDDQGLTRDFVTTLFQAVFDPMHPKLPMKTRQENEKYIPIIDNTSTISLSDQIKSYHAIGAIFSLAFQGVQSITTGSYFKPVIFRMIHSLSKEEIVNIPDHLENVNEVPRQTLNKLLSIYAKDELGMSDGYIQNILNGSFNDELAECGVTSMQDFYNISSFNKVILPTLLIAKSMNHYLSRNYNWDVLKGNSAEAFSKKIEGSLTAQQVLDGLRCASRNSASTMGFLRDWIQNAALQQLEKFTWAIGGTKTLTPHQKLRVTLCSDTNRFPTYAACSFSMTLPKYQTCETLKLKLEQSLQCVNDGFQRG